MAAHRIVEERTPSRLSVAAKKLPTSEVKVDGSGNFSCAFCWRAVGHFCTRAPSSGVLQP
eukprot:SAG31_NODE_28838_length_404_cov_1.190164_1_plen_59_part_10